MFPRYVEMALVGTFNKSSLICAVQSRLCFVECEGSEITQSAFI